MRLIRLSDAFVTGKYSSGSVQPKSWENWETGVQSNPLINLIHDPFSEVREVAAGAIRRLKGKVLIP